MNSFNDEEYFDWVIQNSPIEEDWRKTTLSDAYYVSSLGRLFSRRSQDFVKGTYVFEDDRAKGLRVSIFLDSHKPAIKTYIHVLVADAFLDDYISGMYIRHLDGDKTNNSVDNLYILGPGREENLRDRYVAEYGGGRVVIINETGDIFPNVPAAALSIGGDESAIYKCLRGERAQHLGLTFRYLE